MTINMNGIRSASSKGFWDWFLPQDVDVLCIQELKAKQEQLPESAKPDGYFRYFHIAEKAGYSGVALYSKIEPDAVYVGLAAIDPDTDWRDMDAEGRFVMADFGKLSIMSVYFPSGSSSEERQAVKMTFLARFLPLFNRLKDAGRELILCADVNICHHEIDLKNWRGNRKNSGFLPEERAWMNQMIHESGFVDVFRNLYPEKEQYSWWSNRGQARANNVGWRIDYHITTPEIAKRFEAVEVYTDAWFSDHAPVLATMK